MELKSISVAIQLDSARRNRAPIRSTSQACSEPERTGKRGRSRGTTAKRGNSCSRLMRFSLHDVDMKNGDSSAKAAIVKANAGERRRLEVMEGVKINHPLRSTTTASSRRGLLRSAALITRQRQGLELFGRVPIRTSCACTYFSSNRFAQITHPRYQARLRSRSVRAERCRH